MKPHIFGCLRMQYANLSHDKDAFRAYLKSEGYNEKEMQEIREAFLSIGKENECKGGKTFGGKG